MYVPCVHLTAEYFKLVDAVETFANLPRRYAPAWSLSLGLHALLLVLLGLGIRSVPGPVVDLPAREVGIVLTEPPANRADRLEQASTTEATTVDYDDPRILKENQASIGNIDSALPGGEDAAELSVPDIHLPGDSVPLGSADGLVIERLLSGARRSTAVLPGLGDEAILAEEAARRAAQQTRGPATRVSLFGSAAANGYRFVFAIDRSASMGGSGLNALAAASTELSRSLAHLLPSHSFQIVAYHHQCVYLQKPRLLPATDENKATVAPFVAGLGALGGTGHDMALRASLALEPDAIFLLTDAGDPHLTEIQLTNLRKLAAGRTAIHCIRFGFGPDGEADHFMKRLAAQNSGSYTYVDMSKT
jgi:hypothetical protein